jgi:aminoglycoside phosphotransferase (APT) family kinase protein
MPDYSPTIVAILNDRYVLRASMLDGAARFARERRALDLLRALPGIPQILGAGTFTLEREAHYLLQNKIPGRTVFPLWLELRDEVRVQLVTELAAIIRRVHRIPLPTYAIGHYQSALRDWRGTWLAGHDTYIGRLLARVRARDLTADQADLVREAERYYAAHRAALSHTVGPRFAHGDLHLYNILADEGRITGVIDWEWAYGGGSEPDFDLEALIRWAIYPRGIAEEELEERVTGDDFAVLIPALLAAYPEIHAIPRLHERMTIYQIEHELHHMAAWPPRVPQEPVRRLRGWVREQCLVGYLG